MELELNQEQILFQDSLNKFFRQALPVDALRRFSDEGSRFDESLWNKVRDLGIPGILVPEEHGGSGLGMLDAALAAEAMGGSAAPVNFVGASVMATTAFLSSGNKAQQGAWLPRIARGEARIAVAFVSGLSDQTGEADAALDANRLSGRITGVIDIEGATHILAYLADGRAALVDATAAGVSTQMRVSLDRTRPIADVTFKRVQADTLDASKDRFDSALRVLDAGRLMLAADTLGAAQTMLDKAVAYAKERVQFGRVIGSFQGVKYMCADMVTMLAPCHAFVWQSARVQEAGGNEARLAACHVKAHLGDVGRDVSRMATEVHGGIGFTDLLGLHYWLKRIGYNRQMLGSSEICRRQAGRLQGWMSA